MGSLIHFNTPITQATSLTHKMVNTQYHTAVKQCSVQKTHFYEKPFKPHFEGNEFAKVYSNNVRQSKLIKLVLYKYTLLIFTASF